ncbi:hypothetical protein BHM03_00021196, partial [Ensete ventricosum]
CLDRSGREQEHEEVGEAGRRERNPYFFGKRSYEQWSRWEHGRFEFARRSELLVGVENYRLAVLEAEPKRSSTEKLERLFGKQKRGEFVRITEEQMRALTQSTSEGGWPLAGSTEPALQSAPKQTHAL